MYTHIIFMIMSPSTRKQRPLHGPQRGPYGERRPFPEPSYTYSSGSQVKKPLQVSLAELSQRHAPFPDPSFVRLPKSHVNASLYKFPTSTRLRHAFCKFKIYETQSIHAKFKQLSCVIYRYNKVTMSMVPSNSTVTKQRTLQEKNTTELG
jgi:hypothetical protein